MPRNGSGVYSKPAGTTAVPNTTIESAKFNAVVDDIASDLNAARPIVAGGTGGTTAAGARSALVVPTYVATRTAMKALDTTKDTVAFLKEAGREGVFKWTTGNFSTQITADTNEGIYVKADAIASTAGAWVRDVKDSYLATWFGFQTGSIAGNSAKLQSAISLADGKFPIVIPPATDAYVFDAQVAVVKNFTHIIAWGATLHTTGANTIFFVPVANSDVRFTGGKYTSDGLGNGYGIRVNGNRCTVEYAEFSGFGDSGSSPVGWCVYFDGVNGAISGCRCVGCYMHDCDAGGIGQYASADSQIIANRCVNLGLEGVSCDRSGGNHAIVGFNNISNVCLVAGVGGIGVDTNNYTLIIGNQIRGSNIGAGITAQNNVGITDALVIKDNVLVDNASGGVRLKNGTGGNSRNCFIDGNKFNGVGTTSIVIDSGCTGNVIGSNDYGDTAVPSVPADTKGVPQVFAARNTAIRTDVTGDGTTYTIPFDSQTFAKGISYNTSTGVATINVAGYYKFSASARVQNLGAAHTELILSIDPSTGGSSRVQTQLNAAASPTVSGACIASRVYQFAAGDTVSASVRVIGGTKTVAVSADSSFTYFSGGLVSPL